MADDEVAAALTAIRERDQRVQSGRGTVGGLLAVTEARNDTPRLLAALEAALKLADRYDAESRRLWDQIREADGRSVMTGSKSIDAAWNGDAAKAIREAIARELTGKGNDAAVCRHCGNGIVRCEPQHEVPVCKGWKHAEWLSMPIGAHYCGGRSVNPSAEPATRETGEVNGG